MPRVSVVVPLYNGETYIRETLLSIQSQTFQDIEAIIVDDGSEDRGPEVVRSILDDPRFRLIKKPHLGIARTRNLGASFTSESSEFFAFLDQDDVWSADFLHSIVHTLDGRPEASAAFALADFIDESGQPIDPGSFSGYMRSGDQWRDGRLLPRDPSADLTVTNLFLMNPLYPPSCLLVRRNVFERAGGFDPRYLVADDWDFAVRTARLGPIAPLDRVLVGYRRHQANASLNLRRNVRETRRVWATTYYSPLNTPGMRDDLAGIWRAHQKRTARQKIEMGRLSLRHGGLVRGVATIIDGLAHLALRRPLRTWALKPVDDHRRPQDSVSAAAEPTVG